MSASRVLKIVTPVVAVAVVVAAGIALAVSLRSSSAGSNRVELLGVPLLDAEQHAGLRLAAPAGASPALSAEDAVSVAKEDALTRNAEVLEAKLVGLSVPGRFANERLAWAVNFDPGTVIPVQPLGPAGRAPLQDYGSAFMVVFIDANSGEFLMLWTAGALSEASDQ